MTFGFVDSDSIAVGAIDVGHIRDSAANSVLGRAAATTGVLGDIIYNSEETGRALRVSGAGIVGFGQIDSDSIVSGAIDQVHLSSGASKFTNRQGGNATEWDVPGSTNYVPTTVRMQGGIIATSASADITITYPAAFSARPLFFVTYYDSEEPLYLDTVSYDAASMTISVRNSADARVATLIQWLAIGPE